LEPNLQNGDVRASRNGRGFVEKAKKINLDFLLELFLTEADDRDIKRRNALIKAAKFDIQKTFELFVFDDIKFPKSITPDDVCVFIPKHENLIL